VAELIAGIVARAREAVVDGIGLLLVIIGAALASTIIGWIRKWFPEQTKDIADEAIATVVGFILLMWGGRIHPRVTSIGFGVFLAGIGAWAEGVITPMIPKA